MSANATPRELAAPPRASIVLNVALSQAGWFACVLSAAHGAPGVGTAVAACIVLLHLALVASAVAVGAVLDSTLVAAGLIDFNGGKLLANGTTHWMLALWALFAITLNASLRWLRGRPVLAAVFGALGGPAAYGAGASLGALSLLEPVAATLALAVGWAIAAPLLATLAVRFDETRA